MYIVVYIIRNLSKVLNLTVTYISIYMLVFNHMFDCYNLTIIWPFLWSNGGGHHRIGHFHDTQTVVLLVVALQQNTYTLNAKPIL